MKFCPKCGAEISEEATFCHDCGANLSSNSSSKDFNGLNNLIEFFHIKTGRILSFIVLIFFTLYFLHMDSVIGYILDLVCYILIFYFIWDVIDDNYYKTSLITLDDIHSLGDLYDTGFMKTVLMIILLVILVLPFENLFILRLFAYVFIIILTVSILYNRYKNWTKRKDLKH